MSSEQKKNLRGLVWAGTAVLIVVGCINQAKAESHRNYFPLNVGNSWTYTDGTEEKTFTIIGTEQINGHTYYKFDDYVSVCGFPGYGSYPAEDSNTLFRYDPCSDTVLQYWPSRNEDVVRYDFSQNMWGECGNQLIQKGHSCMVPAGIFDNCCTFQFAMLVYCGLFYETLAPGVGNIAFETSWIGSFELQSYTIIVPWTPDNVEIVPENPTSADVVDITFSGNWRNSCIPVDSYIEVDGSDIYFGVISDTNESCWQAITPWELTESAGRLSPGTYSIYASLDRGPWTLMTEFNVIAHPGTGTHTYVFLPQYSTVIEDGGYGGWHNTYSIEGRFQLAVDFDANTASFDHVDANLSSHTFGGYGRSLDNLFDMTELVGTVVSATEIEFDTADPIPGGKVVHLDLTFADNSVYLTGGFCELFCADCFCYYLDARAQKLIVYYVDAADGNDLNDGLTPETAFATIQKGIDTAQDGDTVIVADGIYTGAGNRDIDFKGKAITVKSENGPRNCIIDCQGSYTDCHRGFYFHNHEDANSIVQGFTVINGLIRGTIKWQEDPWNQGPHHVIGAGIYCEFSSPTIVNCAIRDCTTELGAGIGCVGASPVIIDCTIADCHAGGLGLYRSGGYGGGIGLIRKCNAKITNCTITNNMGYYNSYGGGIYCIDGSPEINGCTISGNSTSPENAGMYGGGVYCGWCSNMTLRNCIIAENTAHLGGGIFCDGGSTPTIANCIITANTAELYGSDGGRGGGIYCGCGDRDHVCAESNPTIINCTVTGNTAEEYGGGIFCGYNNNTTISNCIFRDDTAVAGAEIALDSYSGLCTLTLSYSDVQGGQDGAHVGTGCILNWGADNIDADPCFVDPCNGDYHLKSQGWRWDKNVGHGSPWKGDYVTSRCIDAGNPGSPLGDELLTIPDDPNQAWGVNLRINMGAYGGTAQASMAPYNWTFLGDLSNDGTVDYADLAGQIEDWLITANEQPGDLNRDYVVNMIDFAALAQDWLQTTDWFE
jgi:hypothetical protein